MTLTKIKLLLLVSLTNGIIGHFNTTQKEIVNIKKNIINDSKKSFNKKSIVTLTSNNQNIKEDLSKIKLAINKFPIYPNKDNLYKMLGEDEIGTVILNAIKANALEDKINGANKVREEAYQKARENSNASIKKIVETVHSLKINGDSIDKMRLLDIANHLEGVDEEVLSLAKDVLSDNIVSARPSSEDAQTEEELNAALSTTFEMAVPVMAHLIAMAKTNDLNEALDISLDAIQDQPEIFITNQIVDNAIKEFPDLEEMLLQAKSDKERSLKKVN